MTHPTPDGLSRLRKRNPWAIALAVAGVLFAAALVAFGLSWCGYYQGQRQYAEIADLAGADDLAGASAGGNPSGRDIDWDALAEVNPDVVAWVVVPGTRVSYPVARTSDNEYYLTHGFGGESGPLSGYGAIFMDYRNDPDWNDEGYFLYGHHMNDGSMFSDVAALADQGRFDTCRAVLVLTPTRDFELRTFSVIHCADDDAIVETSFSAPADKAAYVQDKMDRSVVGVPEDVPPAADIADYFALATCDDASTGRYVLYAYEN